MIRVVLPFRGLLAWIAGPEERDFPVRIGNSCLELRFERQGAGICVTELANKLGNRILSVSADDFRLDTDGKQPFVASWLSDGPRFRDASGYFSTRLTGAYARTGTVSLPSVMRTGA